MNKHSGPILYRWTEKDFFKTKFCPKMPYQLNKNLICLENLVIILTFDIASEVAKGHRAKDDKGSYSYPSTHNQCNM